MSDTSKPRREFRNLGPADLLHYRLPLAGWNSILHRISGALLFLLLPWAIWMFDKSLTSQISFERFTAVLSNGFVRFITWGLLTAYIYHFFAGLRHLVLDVTHRMTKDFGRHTAVAVFAATAVVSLLCAGKLAGLY